MADNPTDNLAPLLQGVLWGEAGLATVVFGVRLVVRIVHKMMGWDDYIMILGTLLNYVGLAILTLSTTHGLGRHQSTLPASSRTLALEYQFIAQPVEVTAMMIARISITVMLIRLFPTKIWLARFLIAITVLGVIFTVLPTVMPFTCTPVQAMWDESVQGTCPEGELQVGFALTKASLSAVTDLTVALWPIFIIWNLQMRMRIKLSLCFIFALSLLAMAGSVAEACTLDNIAVRSDATYQMVYVFIWIVTQTHLIIILGCLPALWPLFNTALSKNRSRRRRNHTLSKRTLQSFWRRNQRQHSRRFPDPYDTAVTLGLPSEFRSQITAQVGGEGGQGMDIDIDREGERLGGGGRGGRNGEKEREREGEGESLYGSQRSIL